MRRLIWVVGALLSSHPALAHEVMHEVVRGRAIAVRVVESDGESVAGAAVDVFSPRDASTPRPASRTDQFGWTSFVPDVAGSWRLKVVSADGHGLDTSIAVTTEDLEGRAPVMQESHDHPPLARGLRPLVGIAGIVVVFGGLAAFYRRKGKAKHA